MIKIILNTDNLGVTNAVLVNDSKSVDDATKLIYRAIRAGESLNVNCLNEILFERIRGIFDGEENVEFCAISKGFIDDIVFNQDFDFEAGDIQKQIARDYGIEISVNDIDDEIAALYGRNCIEYAQADRTIDMFGSLNANFAEQFA